MSVDSAQPTDRILIVDDEPEIVALVAYHLTMAGYRTLSAVNGSEAVETARKNGISLLILDLLLPDMSGFEVLERIRAHPNPQNAPCLMLSALRDDTDRIRGLSVGADDYLTKPFNPDELVLRVGAILRRARAPRLLDDVETIGPVSIDRGGRRVIVKGQDAGLTPTEYRLLLLLASNPGLAQGREQLLRMVWGAEPDMQTRTVDVHIQRLRTKLGAAGDMIETVRGYGYRLATPDTN
jgi:two-component system phosphate regulon response regulator PhoB